MAKYIGNGFETVTHKVDVCVAGDGMVGGCCAPGGDGEKGRPSALALYAGESVAPCSLLPVDIVERQTCQTAKVPNRHRRTETKIS